MSNKTEIIDLFINEQVLQFGEFELKSGRKSPYFFNLGSLCSGQAIGQLGEYFADKLIAEGLSQIPLFGPAYKGIPIVTATAFALAQKTNAEIPFAYNRKEAKDHGEGGVLVGAKSKQYIIIDDVISAGATAHALINQLQGDGVEVAAWVVALDRQEQGHQGDEAASGWLSQETGVPVYALMELSDLLAYVQNHHDFKAYADAMQSYRHQYGRS